MSDFNSLICSFQFICSSTITPRNLVDRTQLIFVPFITRLGNFNGMLSVWDGFTNKMYWVLVRFIDSLHRNFPELSITIITNATYNLCLKELSITQSVIVLIFALKSKNVWKWKKSEDENWLKFCLKVKKKYTYIFLNQYFVFSSFSANFTLKDIEKNTSKFALCENLYARNRNKTMVREN